MLQPIIDALVPYLPGWLELPESYAGLLKSASHRYIKRVPKAGGGYRYFYHVGHGGGIHAEDHFVPGASFRFEGGHYHIKSTEGGKLVIEHDETKERKTVSKSELRTMLGAHHEKAISAHREKVAGMLAEARANKASPKQIARLEARAEAAGTAPKAEAKDKAKPSRSDYKTKAHRASVATWEVEITTPDGKTRWERVGGERPIKDAAEASKIALDQFLGTEESASKSKTEPKGTPATSKREAKVKAPGNAKTEPKTESSRPATLQQETERQYKRIWSDYDRLLSTASKSRAEQLRPQFEARARSMAEDRAKRLIQHRKDPRFHEDVDFERKFNKQEGMNDYEAMHLAELTVMDRASEQRGLRRER